jgi:hypothetical protein
MRIIVPALGQERILRAQISSLEASSEDLRLIYGDLFFWRSGEVFARVEAE